VTAFVRDDPHASGDCALEEPVGGPEESPTNSSRDWGSIDEGGSPIESSNHYKIGEKESHGTRERTLETVGRDGLAKLPNGEVWGLSGLAILGLHE